MRKLTKPLLREMIRTILREMSATGDASGYNSKNFLDPDFDEEDIVKSKSGPEGTGKDRKTRKTGLKLKEMGAGMELAK